MGIQIKDLRGADHPVFLIDVGAFFVRKSYRMPEIQIDTGVH